MAVIAIALVAAYAAVVLLFVLFQERLQFIPETRYVTPAQVGLSGVDEVTIPTPDGERLRAWHVAARDGMPTILFLHGNAGSIGYRGERFAVLAARGYGVLFVDYRGFGGSTGRPSEAGLLTDAEASYDWLTKQQGVDPRHLMLLGESLGTGVAVMLAARRPVAAVCLEAAYTSIADVAKGHYWWLPVKTFIRNPFHADESVARINAPLLILHGSLDQVIPIAFARKLFALAREPKTFVELPAASHMFFSADVFDQEDAFFRAAVARAAQ